jgi:ADP-ribosylglycohydrolase
MIGAIAGDILGYFYESWSTKDNAGLQSAPALRRLRRCVPKMDGHGCSAPTHGHPEGVKGAQAVALNVLFSETGAECGEGSALERL